MPGTTGIGETQKKNFTALLSWIPTMHWGEIGMAGTFRCEGVTTNAVDEHERARELEPDSLIINANLARSLYWARRYDEAILQARKTLQMDPGFGVALFWLEGSLRHKNLFQEAIALRLAMSSPERAHSIRSTFQDRRAFKRSCARMGKPSRMAGT